MKGQLLVWATKLAKAGLVRLRLSGEEHIIESVRQGRPVIFAGWHGHNFLTMLSYHVKIREHFHGVAIMVPEDKYGLVLDHYGKKLDIDVVKVKAELGPSQWARATVSLIKLIRAGNCVMLSPDGPSGPPYQAKPGIAVIGQQTGAVIIPASAAVKRGFKLRRWDEHLVPWPFARAVVHFGAPIDSAPAEGHEPSAEELRERIEQALMEGAFQADLLVQGESIRGRSAAKEETIR